MFVENVLGSEHVQVKKFSLKTATWQPLKSLLEIENLKV
jgi:hypothetical protein